MIISDKEAIERLQSPMNLMNRLRNKSLDSSRNKAMSLFVGNRTQVKANPPEIKPFNPFASTSTETPAVNTDSDEEPEETKKPTIDNLIENAEDQIKLKQAHDDALEVLGLAVLQMKNNIDNIKPDKLPSVISATSKVVEGIRRERNEAAKSKENKSIHYHFYTPEQKKLNDYEIVEVN